MATGLTLLLGLVTACGDDDSAADDAAQGSSTGDASSTSTPSDDTGDGGIATQGSVDDSATDDTTSTNDSATDDSATDTGVAELTNVEKAQLLISAFESGDPAALDVVSDRMYTQHNLAFPDGKDVLVGFFTGEPTGFTVVNHRVFEDGDIVFMHNEYGGTWNRGTPQAGFDVFRFQDGLIVEHWDNLDDIVDDRDGTTQLDGVTESSAPRDTDANQAVVQGLLDNVFIGGQWSTIDDYFDLDGYIQHSVGFGADSAGLVALAGMLPDGTPFYSSVEFVYAQGDMVLSMSEGIPDPKTGLADAYYDLFRLQDGEIIEHWDIVQTIPDEADWANANGKW